MQIAACCLVVGGAISLSTAASASIITYNFDISGSQEVPAVDTPATGVGLVTINTETNLLTWDISYQDLIGTMTVAHFHGPADFGANAPVELDITDTGTPGTQSGSFLGEAMITNDQMAQLLDGLWYINIHSTFSPPGEIRGQVIPAPGVIGLLAFAGCIGSSRKRRAN
ncbi:MAG: CHRD domain-containing protein [Phycisphaerales bacterium]|nr:MAG: CHRD domain-containing protein [Phycisphaerales bacterium]